MTPESCLYVKISLMVCAVLLGMAIAPESAHAAEADESWQFLLQDTPYAVRYYDPKGVTLRSPGRVEIRTKTVPTDKGNPRIKEIESLWEFDCTSALFRNAQTRVVFVDGEVEESHTPYEWSQVHREIWVSVLRDLACKKKEDPVRDGPREAR